MRLLGPYIFVLVGLLIGCATTYLFTSNPMRLIPNILLGIVGSFFGLWIRDIFDIDIGGNLSGALLAAAVGALLLTVPVNIFYSMRHQRKMMQ